MPSLGFDVFDPAQDANEIFEIFGFESQIVEFNMKPGMSIQSEPGTLLHRSEQISVKTKIGSLARGVARSAVGGESMVKLKFVNDTDKNQSLGLTPNFPAKIIPLDLTKFSGMTIKKGAFMAAISDDIKIKYRIVRSAAAALCGGQGVILNSLHGTGIGFLCASGTIMSKSLKNGEEMIIDPACLLAFEASVSFNVRRNGSLSNMLCSGEGIFNAVLTGPGHVFIQSMPFDKIAKVIAPLQGQ